MYKVVDSFFDLQDGNRYYRAGDEYPRPGFEVSAERIADLAGDGNRMGHPLIVAIKPKEEERPTRKRVKKDA